jgi:hypothetical protein
MCRCPPSRLVMIGDRYLTDVVYGNRHGMLTIRPSPLTLQGEPFTVRLVRAWTATCSPARSPPWRRRGVEREPSSKPECCHSVKMRDTCDLAGQENRGVLCHQVEAQRKDGAVPCAALPGQPLTHCKPTLDLSTLHVNACVCFCGAPQASVCNGSYWASACACAGALSSVASKARNSVFLRGGQQNRPLVTTPVCRLWQGVWLQCTVIKDFTPCDIICQRFPKLRFSS